MLLSWDVTQQIKCQYQHCVGSEYANDVITLHSSTHEIAQTIQALASRSHSSEQTIKLANLNLHLLFLAASKHIRRDRATSWFVVICQQLILLPITECTNSFMQRLLQQSWVV